MAKTKIPVVSDDPVQEKSELFEQIEQMESERQELLKQWSVQKEKTKVAREMLDDCQERMFKLAGALQETSPLFDGEAEE